MIACGELSEKTTLEKLLGAKSVPNKPTLSQTKKELFFMKVLLVLFFQEKDRKSQLQN
jgi:hypothetical protein